MNKILIFIILSFLLLNQVSAKSPDILKFSSAGQFKIVQFTDTHIDLIKGSNLEVYQTIRRVIEIEKPDLAILTGDIVTQNDPQEAYRKLSDVFASCHLPWAMVFGNHDSEHNFTREQLADFLPGLPFCLNNDQGDLTENSNFILQVYGENKKLQALIYGMDSNSYSTLKPNVDGYGWFSFSQISGYIRDSKEFTRLNNNVPLPALAFFHIPVPEYNNAWNPKKTVVIGSKNEDVSCANLNSGMFAAMLECGDVMGIFVGHDHTNDYIGLCNNIALAYGRVTKKMKDPADPLAGGRVIVLKEGRREFDTWIREAGGKKVLACTYPNSFAVKK